MVIMAEFINNNGDSFVDIDDFDLDDDGADIEELDDNDEDPTIPSTGAKCLSASRDKSDWSV
jgi:hypothetical protein